MSPEAQKSHQERLGGEEGDSEENDQKQVGRRQMEEGPGSSVVTMDIGDEDPDPINRCLSIVAGVVPGKTLYKHRSTDFSDKEASLIRINGLRCFLLVDLQAVVVLVGKPASNEGTVDEMVLLSKKRVLQLRKEIAVEGIDGDRVRATTLFDACPEYPLEKLDQEGEVLIRILCMNGVPSHCSDISIECPALNREVILPLIECLD